MHTGFNRNLLSCFIEVTTDEEDLKHPVLAHLDTLRQGRKRGSERLDIHTLVKRFKSNQAKLLDFIRQAGG